MKPSESNKKSRLALLLTIVLVGGGMAVGLLMFQPKHQLELSIDKAKAGCEVLVDSRPRSEGISLISSGPHTLEVVKGEEVSIKLQMMISAPVTNLRVQCEPIRVVSEPKEGVLIASE